MSDTVLIRLVKNDDVMASGVVFKAELKNAAKRLWTMEQTSYRNINLSFEISNFCRIARTFYIYLPLAGQILSDRAMARENTKKQQHPIEGGYIGGLERNTIT